MDRIAVLIPCWNEEKTIRKVVTDVRARLPEATVYVYDNNSTDATARLAAEAGAVVRRERKQGKGNVIRRMFREIDAECYVMLDGDDTYPTDNVGEMVRMVLEEHSDMVVGDRLSSTYFTENKRRFHSFGNVLVRKSINLLFHSDIRDIMTGYRAFSYAFVKTFPVLSRGFEIETEMTVHAISHNLQVDNLVSDYKDRPAGSVSKLNTVRDGLRVLATVVRLFRDYRPYAFFGCIALLLTLCAAGVFIPAVWLPYRASGLVEHFPTLIVCGFALLAAILLYVTGLILNTMAQKNRQEFEFRLQLADIAEKRLKAAEEDRHYAEKDA